jgi:integrase
MTVRVKWQDASKKKVVVEIYFRQPDLKWHRERRRFPATSLASAKAWGDRREAQVRADYQSKPSTVKVVPTFADFAPRYVDKLRSDLCKPSWVLKVESLLRLHILPFVGNVRLNVLSGEHITSMRKHWVEGDYLSDKGTRIEATSSKGTHRGRLVALLGLLSTAVEWNVVDATPCKIRLPVVDDQREARFHDHATYERLVAAAARVGARQLAVVLLGGEAGLRRNEIISLRWDDIDDVAGRLHVRTSAFFAKGKRLDLPTKGDKEAPLRMTSRLREALQAVRSPSKGPRVFYTNGGRETTPWTAQLWVRQVEKEAGLPVTGHIHIFRHTFVSHLAMAGLPARTIQQLARHGDLKTTLRYMHLSPSARDEGMDMLMQSRSAGGKPVVNQGPAQHPASIIGDEASRSARSDGGLTDTTS